MWRKEGEGWRVKVEGGGWRVESQGGGWRVEEASNSCSLPLPWVLLIYWLISSYLTAQRKMLPTQTAGDDHRGICFPARNSKIGCNVQL